MGLWDYTHMLDMHGYLCVWRVVSTTRARVHSMVPRRMLPEALAFPESPSATSAPLLCMWTELSCVKSHLEISPFKWSRAQT